MSTLDMKRVYRLLKDAREEGIIAWDYIVDEAREFERVSQWDNPEEFARCAGRQYRRDFWKQQPVRCEVWSEKGTLRGVLEPVLDAYGVGFRVMHGFSSATVVHDIAEDYDGRKLIAFYVGDWDPSGLYMSARDLPDRLEKYGGDHVELRRIALVERDTFDAGLPSFPATKKRKDPRFKWFTEHYPGTRCWEIDALDPNELRDRVEKKIKRLLDWDEWHRCVTVDTAERESLCGFLRSWAQAAKGEAE
jgi:hypothetical protein